MEDESAEMFAYFGFGLWSRFTVAVDAGDFSRVVSASISLRLVPSPADVEYESVAEFPRCLSSASTPTPRCFPRSVKHCTVHRKQGGAREKLGCVKLAVKGDLNVINKKISTGILNVI